MRFLAAPALALMALTTTAELGRHRLTELCIEKMAARPRRRFRRSDLHDCRRLIMKYLLAAAALLALSATLAAGL